MKRNVHVPVTKKSYITKRRTDNEQSNRKQDENE